MAEQKTKVEYYRPVLPKSMQSRLDKLFEEFPEVSEAYDRNASKFVHIATIELIRKEEELQLAKIQAERDRKSRDS